MQTDQRRPRFAPLRRALLALAAVALTAACERTGPPVLGVALNAPQVDAARLAFEDARARGLELSLDTLFLTEASNDAAPALAMAQRLAGAPGMIAVVGHSNSAASLAASPIYNEQEVVQLSPTASASVYSEAGTFSFRMVPPDRRQGLFLARVVRDSLPADARIALFYVNDDYGRGLRSAVLAGLEEATAPQSIALDLPHTEGLGEDTVMSRHLIEALEASGADAILWLGRQHALHAVLPTIRQRLGPIPIYGGDGLAPARQRVAGCPCWEGVRHVDFVELRSTPRGRRFAERFEARYGWEAGGAEVLTYDAVGLLLEAVADGAESGPELRDYLGSLGRERPAYVGVTGPVQFDATGDVHRPYRLIRLGGEASP